MTRDERNGMLKVTCLLVLGAASLLVTGLTAGCNTTEGFGRDVEATGDAIEDAADDAND